LNTVEKSLKQVLKFTKLKLETGCFSETLANGYHTTLVHNSQENPKPYRRRENLNLKP